MSSSKSHRHWIRLFLSVRGPMLLALIMAVGLGWNAHRVRIQREAPRTPHAYLDAGDPNRALEMIRADRTWIGKTDRLDQTPLHLAVQYGFKDLAKWLLLHGADVNASAYNGFAPLHFATDPEIVRLLIASKADVHAKGAGMTALQAAAQKYAHLARWPEEALERRNHLTISRILLDSGAEYDIASAICLDDLESVRAMVADKTVARSKTAMRLAGIHGRARVMRILLERGADAEDAGRDGLTVSYFAIEHPEVLELLFDAGADPNVIVEDRGNGGRPAESTLLHEAAKKGLVESAKLLHSRGVAIDVTTPSGTRPLHEACAAGQVEMVNWLLQNNADPNPQTMASTPMVLATSGVQPDEVAANARYLAVIRALERAGVELDLFAAIACDDVRQVQRLLHDDPSNVASENLCGSPALLEAVRLDRREIVKLLLDHGCDPNTCSRNRTPWNPLERALHVAAFFGYLDIAATLIKHGADINAKTYDGDAALHHAARMNHVGLARFLLRHGADVNARNEKGETPLEYNVRYGYGDSAETVKLLRGYGGKN